MKTLRKITGSKTGIYGIIITLFSIAALAYTLVSKEQVLLEFEQINKEEKCFSLNSPDPEWEKMTPAQKKAKTNKCMAALNKATQAKTGPYLFAVTLLAGIGLILIALFKNESFEELSS